MKYLTGIIFAFLITSCSTQNMNKASYALEEKWELTSINGEDIQLQKPLTLTLYQNNQLHGYFGCNQVNGTYAIQGDAFVANKLSATRMMCDKGAMAYENTIINALQDQQTIHRDENKISLESDNNQLVFNRIGDTEVVGRYWKLIELDGKKVSYKDNQEAEQFMVLRTGNRMNGFSGCNYFNGSFNLKENSHISFDENMATTMMACPEIDDRSYLQVFKDAETYKVSNNKLYLYNQGKTLAVFEDVLF